MSLRWGHDRQPTNLLSSTLKLEHYVRSEKLEPITARAEPSPVLPVDDVMTYPLYTPLYQIYVNYSFGKVIVATVEMRLTTLWIAGVRQHSDGMCGEGGGDCDELCVCGNSTHVLPVYDVINV